MSKVYDQYKKLDLNGRATSACPLCASAAELWQYGESATAPTAKVVMCTNAEPIGPQAEGGLDGCLLYMPPNDFYRATEREALKYWNDYATALNAQRRKRRWEAASVLRDSPTPAGGPTP